MRKSKTKNQILFLCLGIGLLLVCPKLIFAADGGARPISFGGAFVAIADDAHAASWNPASLAWQDSCEATYSGIINSREDYITAEFISDDYLAYAMPIKVDETGRRVYDSFGGVGFYVNSNQYEHATTRAKTKLWQSGVSFGRCFADSEVMAWGVSLNYYMFDAQLTDTSSSDTALSVNLGYLWYLTESLTFGFLWENLNEPVYTVLGSKNRLTRILRPGIAYYFNEDTLICLEIYDFTGNTEEYSQDLRLGFEYNITEVLSFRLGMHHPNSEAESAKFYTFGVGIQRTDFFMSYPVNYYLDYTFVTWEQAPSGMDDYTHQIGLTFKF